MAVAYLRKPFRTVVGKGLDETIYVFNGPTTAPTPVDMTGWSADAKLTPANGGAGSPITLTSGSGAITLGLGFVTLHVASSGSTAWVPGDYDVQIDMQNPAHDYVDFTLVSDPTVSRAQILASL